MINEIPITTLDARELLIQFRLMKALGYHSLWDANFQKELRNPLRRMLYYRLMIMDDAQNKIYQIDVLKNIANRISYFSDPQLFKKVSDMEEQKALDSMSEEEQQTLENTHSRVMSHHPQMSEKDLEKVRTLLNT